MKHMVLQAQKKSVLQQWSTQYRERPKTFDTSQEAMVPPVLERLGIHEDQLPGVTPADAGATISDWRDAWLDELVP